MAAKDYANTRYSTLDQITKGNVGKLQVAWTFSTGTTRGHEAAPLVVGDTMYVVTPYPNILYALDLKKRGQLEMEVRAQTSLGSPGSRLLRRGQSGRRLRRRQDLL
jgi:glucose dehydrogenase